MAETTKRWPRPERVTNLDEALGDVEVHEPGSWVMDSGMTTTDGGWYAVSTGDDGIVATFRAEHDAYRFRLDLINYWLNG